MQETVSWSAAGPAVRMAVVELCGWANQHGNATPTGKRITETSWDGLTSAARRILLSHGITS